MATRRIKVSRHGLTTCPSCLSHIQTTEELEHTSCPFCGSNLVEEVKRSPVFGGGFQRMLGATRTGLLAAALVGTPLIVGCELIEDDDDTVESDMGDEPIPTPDYGVEAPPEDMGVDADMAEEPTPQPDYGVFPPEDMG